MPTADPVPARAESEWVFLARFLCARCGRDVTIRHYPGDPRERRMTRYLRVCPDGCA
jgi:hypothetical protein